jgi:glycosyltransferase involved in cell wall biosynthesis
MAQAGNVVLNALFLDPSSSGGPETYLRGLAPSLQSARPGASLTVATTHRGARALRDAGWPDRGIAIRELPCDEGQRVRRQAAEQLLLPRLARRVGAEVLHSLASVAPIRVPGLAHVVTVHDVNFIHHATFNPITSWGMRQIVPRAARRAEALIAVSATARDDICATLSLPSEKFTVITNPPAEVADGSPQGEELIRRRFGLGADRVVLCVAAKRPHKNQAALIRALPQLPSDIRLVLVGHPEPYEATLRRLAPELGVENRVVFADWVSREDLEGLWSAASVAAFPTLAEGLGLPVLEAMERGVPVAASNLPVLREIGGSWPAYFDPHDPADVARAILGVLENPPDPDLARRLASRFSWESAALATWGVYDRALAVRGQSNGRPVRGHRGAE